jgi:diadenosine tetraphosphate (Ap4A) HIT family hydrolase
VASAGWPADWQERKEGRDCSLCSSVGLGDNDHSIAITELPYSEVRLERRSRLPGYCIVVWRHGHVAEPTELDVESATGYWHDVLAVSRVLQAEFEPAKMNLLTLGNWVPHLHTHVVPRYLDDPAPGGPIAWDAMFTDEPTDPDELRRRADSIRAALSG